MVPWEVRYKVAVGIAKALEHLHKGCTRPVIHRDVKTSNILLTADFESQVPFHPVSFPFVTPDFKRAMATKFISTILCIV